MKQKHTKAATAATVAAGKRRLTALRLGERLGFNVTNGLEAVCVEGHWMAAGEGIVVAAADEADARQIVQALATVASRHPLTVATDEPGYRTGYFASPARPHRRGMVHAVVAGRPLCGASVKSEFQWTGSVVECNRCRKIVEADDGKSKS